MTGACAALVLWEAFPEHLAQLAGDRPAPDLTHLGETARSLPLRLTALGAVPPPVPRALAQALEARALVEGDPDRLDNLSLRRLCRHPRTALEASWVRALARAGRAPRRSWMEGLLVAYLDHWRSMPEPEALEEALWALVQRAASTRAWAQLLKDEIYPFLGPQAPEHGLSRLQPPLESLGWLLSHWPLSLQQGLGPALLTVALRRWCRDWLEAGAEAPDTLSCLQAGLELLARESALPPVSLASPLSQLILSEAATRRIEVRQALLSFALRHPQLGDPRHPGGLWSTMGAARTRMSAWMETEGMEGKPP
nr:hypothetical protein [uncultured Holophaga sp.]